VPTRVLYEWQHGHVEKPCWNDCPIPPDAARYLKPDNPRLIELQQRYRAFDSDVTAPSLWTDGYVRSEDITYFRGDNAWVWQVRGTNSNILAYAVSLYYLKSIDHSSLLEQLVEDNSFGTFTFPIAGRQVSRDLLDSNRCAHFSSSAAHGRESLHPPSVRGPSPAVWNHPLPVSRD
jgi:hypothetical protein